METILHCKESQRIYFPHPDLMKYVAHYTINRVDARKPQRKNLTIVPDASGCIVFIIRENSYQASFWGSMTKTTQVSDEKEEVLYFFIEFLPAGAYQLLGIDQRQYSDLRIPLSDISSELEKEVFDCFYRVNNFTQLVNEVNQLLLRYLYNSRVVQPIFSILPHIQNSAEHFTVQSLAKDVFYSERQMHRYFQSGVGMSVKQYMRITKINQAIQLFLTPLTLKEIAYQIGYYDQSHFIHDFKTVCGVTPSVYRQQMSDFYNETYKF